MINRFLFVCLLLFFVLGCRASYDCMSKNMHVKRHARACKGMSCVHRRFSLELCIVILIFENP